MTNSAQSIKASAPATVMLFGEHAVLHGYRAIAAAIDQRLSVTLVPIEQKKIYIDSALGSLDVSLEQISVQKPFDYILACIQSVQHLMPGGCRITVASSFSSQQGLGSSAAVVVATLAVLYRWLQQPDDKKSLLNGARQVLKTLHPLASGTDLAASVFGGAIVFNPKTLGVVALPHLPKIVLVYSGYKTTTAEVIARVEAARKNHRELFNKIFKEIGETTEQAVLAIEQGNWNTLGNIATQQQVFFKALGVVDSTLESIIYSLNQSETISGSKLSGSGLGDCVIGFGDLAEFHSDLSGVEKLPYHISQQGVCYE